MATSVIKAPEKFIKTRTITATTGATGNIATGYNSQICVLCPGKICVPFMGVSGQAGFVKVLTEGLQPVANTEVTLTIWHY